MSPNVSKNVSIELFPVPQPVQFTDLPTPKPLPGATPASTIALREALLDDYKRFHCFFNELGFHNHSAHTAIALWYLGADADIIKAAYANQAAYQRATFSAPGPINKDNWTHHLGNEKYYDAYLAFFVGELAAKDSDDVLEKYVFSDAANFPGSEHQVEMLTRFDEGLLHPFIHAGYGFELGLPGMVAEGLAQAAVHQANGSRLIPPNWFKDTKEVRPNTTKSVIDVLARVITDPEIGFTTTPHLMSMYKQSVQNFAEKIVAHVEAWTPDLSEEGLHKTLEEVVFFANLIYAIPGLVSKEEGGFNADFFTMHFVTSSMFLSSFLVHLKPKSQALLLRSYVSMCLAWFISRGKPQLDIEAFFAQSDSLKSLIEAPPVSRPSLPKIPAASARSSNPWTSVLEATMVHPDEHISKIQRTLMHYAQVYGNIEAGHFKGTELKGAEKIDGTLFVRAANLTAARLNDGVNKELLPGGAISWWDRRGFWPQASDPKL
ncbi:Oxidoreductase AflY [Leucoagaricus sp. SymC.cos]|nr:Oxidoreductase AflY [Leucoagaricus sp. SymC.cos]